MNKILTFCLSLCLIPILGNAQILVSEDFSTAAGSNPPTGWTNNIIAGDPLFDTWRFNNPGNRTFNAPISNPAAIFDSDNYSLNGGAENVALESPVFDATGKLVVVLVFDHFFENGAGGVYFVEAFNGTTWDTVLTGTSLTGNPQNEIIDISASVAGVSNAQIRFRWEGDYSYYWIVDNVTVIAPLPNDIGVVEIVSPKDGCGLGTVELISVAVQNFGLLSQSTFNLALSVDGGPPIAEPYTGAAIAPGMIDTFTFIAGANLSGIGPHSLTAYSLLTGDGEGKNDTTSKIVEHIPLISSFPYHESFANGTGGWVSSGDKSTWAFGTPAKNVITGAASDLNAWVTGGLGTSPYANNENSFVGSPCFDMTTADSNLWVSMNVWWNSEFSWDGTVLQYSNDGGITWVNVGGFGDPYNWYNDDDINSTPGGSLEGWTGVSLLGTGSGGWVNVKHALDTATIGKPDVRFRIAFASDGSDNDDGFAFDDFYLGVPPNVEFGVDSVGVCIGETFNSGFTDPNYTYLWSTGDTTPSIVIQNSFGVDTLQNIWVTVTDSMGLCGADTILLNIPAAAPSITVVIDNNVLCNGDSTGMATAIGSGGIGMLSYLWGTTPIQTSATAVGLPTGIFTVTVTDENNCTADTSIIITQPAALAALIDSVDDVACNGDATGGINVSVSGGTMPYSFAWDNGSSDEDPTGLSIGTYVGTITDFNGCILVTDSIDVTQPDSISVMLDGITDNICPDDSAGTISITVLGGTIPYFYNWSNGAMTQDLTGLPVGSYMGTITDGNGCMLSSPMLEIGATDSLPSPAFGFASVGGFDYSIDFTNSSVNATSYSWDFGDGNTSTDPNPSHDYAANNTYVVTLTATNECGSTSISDTINVLQVSIANDLLSSRISVYPNPSQSFFDVKFDQVSLEDVSLSLSTVDGRIVYGKEIGSVNGLYTHRIELSNSIARGIYVLRITTKDAVVHRRLRLE